MDSPAPLGHGAGSLRTCRCAFSTRSSEAGFANGDVPKNGQICQGGVQYNPDRTSSTQFIVV